MPTNKLYVQKQYTAHGIAVDSEGSIYIGEVGKNYPEGYVGTQKYRRV